MAKDISILVGTIGAGLWTSPDGGRSWGRAGGIWGDMKVFGLKVAPTDPAVVYAGTKGLLDDVPVDQVQTFVRELRDYLKTSAREFVEEIQTKRVMSDAAEDRLKAAIDTVKTTLLAA